MRVNPGEEGDGEDDRPQVLAELYLPEASFPNVASSQLPRE